MELDTRLLIKAHKLVYPDTQHSPEYSICHDCLFSLHLQIVISHRVAWDDDRCTQEFIDNQIRNAGGVMECETKETSDVTCPEPVLLNGRDYICTDLNAGVGWETGVYSITQTFAVGGSDPYYIG